MSEQTATRIEGIGSLQGGKYGEIHIDGLVNIKGDIQFAQCKLNGMGRAIGTLTGDILQVEGTLRAKGSIKVKKLMVEGVVHCGNVKVYADAIDVVGLLESKDEVSADCIRVDGLIRVPTLSGDDIELNYEKANIKGMALLPSKALNLNLNKWVQGVDSIECTRLKASKLVSKTICAQEIHLSNHCCIDVVECDGDIYLDATSKIKEIRGEYRLHHR